MIDDGWAAAATWDARVRTADDIIARAEDDRRAVALIPLSEGTRDISLEPAGSARVRLHQMKPKPHTVDRAEALPAISQFLADVHDVDLVWLSDGTDLGRGTDFIKALAQTLGDRPVTVVDGGIPGAARAGRGRQCRRRAQRQSVARLAGGDGTGTVRALDLKGLPLGEAPFAFKADDARGRSAIRAAGRDPQRHRPPRDFRRALRRRRATARQALAPPHRRHRLRRQRRHWRSRYCRRAITSSARSIRSPTCGSPKAKSPADAVTHFLDQNLPMLILADVGNVAGEAHDRLAHWIEDGGVLVRFAGPRLAASDDDLVPVKLRRGGRILGGSLSWDKPQPLAAFSRESPFNGMAVPNDVTVTPPGPGGAGRHAER